MSYPPKAHVSWVSEVTVKEGKKEEMLQICQKTIDHVKATESGCLMYEWSIQENDGDAPTMMVYHRFRDIEAAVFHMKNAKYFPEMMPLMDFQELRFFGKLEDERLKATWESLNVKEFSIVGAWTSTLSSE